MKKKIMVMILVVMAMLLNFPAVSAAKDQTIDIYLFYGDGCPHCAEEEPYLQSLKETYGDNLVIHEFELWYHPENAPLFESFAAAYGFEPSGVPCTFIGTHYWVGFNEDRKPEIVSVVEDALANGAVNPMDVVEGKIKIDTEGQILSKKQIITLPIIGEVDLSEKSSLLTTAIIGIMDGVNPCSLWVLTMLLAMIVHTNSRKKTFIIGFVYIMITAVIYALFILGVFTALDYVQHLQWIRIVVACITLVMGLINLKDYFWFKEGVSLTIDDAKKPGLYQKMRNVLKKSDNIWTMIGATIILAAGVSLIEFSCTAALPVVWSNIMVQNGVHGAQFWGLLLIYMLLYQLDEIIIFLIATVTMKSNRIEEKHGRLLKLFSGCLMITLSVVMIASPAAMSSVKSTLLVFALALVLTLLILLLTSAILPKFGINIGHRAEKSENRK